MPKFHNDLPIEHPDDDKFEYGALAKAITDCIRGITHPIGSVVAINGPWGSGKSSLVHLVLHELNNNSSEESNSKSDSNKQSDDDPIVISFNSWCYRHEEGIVNGYFRELQLGLSGLNINDGDFSEIQGLIVRLGIVVGGAILSEQEVDAFIVEGTESTFWYLYNAWKVRRKKKKYLKTNNTIQALQKEIGEKLKKRVLIVIDDIDRLSQEEAKAIFRLIKSVGRIRNVVYLLAYDKAVENAIKVEYYSEESHYFEKIVQASFDLPEPDKVKLVEILNTRFEEIFEKDLMISSRRTYDTVHEIVVPELKTLRDVHRLSNILSVTYLSVRHQVDVADFIALEALRIFRPSVYQVIRSKKDVLTRSVGYASDINRLTLHDDIENVYLNNEPESDHDRLKNALIRIFPSATRDFEGPAYSEVKVWTKEKRARSVSHFDSYFVFSIPKDVISESEFEEFSQNANNLSYVKMALRSFIKSKTQNGRTKASFLLDKISRNAESIDINDVGSFLTCLYSMAGELKIDSDSVREFGYLVNNGDRIIRISEKLLVNRLDVTKISNIMLDSCYAAPLDFRTKLCKMSHYFYASSANHRSHQVIKLLTLDDSESLKGQTFSDIRNALVDKSIFGCQDFLEVLEDWHSISQNSDNIKGIFNDIFQSSEDAVTYAREFGKMLPDISHDEYNSRAMVARIERVVDLNNFITRLHQVIQEGGLVKEDKNIINRVIEILSLGAHEVKLS